MTVICSRCETPFDTVHSAAQHAWKSQDGDHDDLGTLDEAIEDVVEDGKSPEEVDLGDGGGDGDPEPPADGNTSPSGEVSADGSGLGLEGPPESAGESEPSDAGDADVDEPDTLACTECDDDLGITEEELREEFPEGAVITCTCGHQMRWADE